MLKNLNVFVVYVSPRGVIIAKCEYMDTQQFLVSWTFIFLFTDYSCSEAFSDSVKTSLDIDLYNIASYLTGWYLLSRSLVSHHILQ